MFSYEGVANQVSTDPNIKEKFSAYLGEMHSTINPYLTRMASFVLDWILLILLYNVIEIFTLSNFNIRS